MRSLCYIKVTVSTVRPIRFEHSGLIKTLLVLSKPAKYKVLINFIFLFILIHHQYEFHLHTFLEQENIFLGSRLFVVNKQEQRWRSQPHRYVFILSLITSNHEKEYEAARKRHLSGSNFRQGGAREHNRTIMCVIFIKLTLYASCYVTRSRILAVKTQQLPVDIYYRYSVITPLSWGSVLAGRTQTGWWRQSAAAGPPDSAAPSSHSCTASSRGGTPTWRSSPYTAEKKILIRC